MLINKFTLGVTVILVNVGRKNYISYEEKGKPSSEKYNFSLSFPFIHPTPGVFNLLRSRANLHLSYNPAGRSHCRLQNHHGYIKHHHRIMNGSPVDVGEVPMT